MKDLFELFLTCITSFLNNTTISSHHSVSTWSQTTVSIWSSAEVCLVIFLPLTCKDKLILVSKVSLCLWVSSSFMFISSTSLLPITETKVSTLASLPLNAEITCFRLLSFVELKNNYITSSIISCFDGYNSIFIISCVFVLSTLSRSWTWVNYVHAHSDN